MPESTCLHIQGRESGPIRVVELPWISVRIGRAAYCEVQLAEFELADEACRLQRRGRSWHLVPVGARGMVSLDGRPVVTACQLSFDVPFTIGPYCLTLRRDRAAEPDWEMYQGPAPPQLNHSAPMRDVRFSADAGPDRPTIGIRTRPTTDPEPPPVAVVDRTESKRHPSSQGPGVKDRWEARFRAAGAELKARAERTRTAGEAKRPDYGTRFDSVPLKEPRVARAHAAAPPKIDPTIRPIPMPVPAKVDANWVTPNLEPPEPLSPPDVARTAPIASERRIETSPHPFDESDFENRLEQALSDAVDLEPGPLLIAETLLEASAGVDQPVVETDQVQEDATLGRLDEADRAADAVAAEPELAGSLSSSLEGLHEQLEWPSARDILATHRVKPDPPVARRAPVKPTGRNRAQASPTSACAPSQWTLPLWLAWPPLAVFVVCAGVVGCTLCWSWGCDSYSAAIMTNRLIQADTSARPVRLPESVGPPRGTWMETSAQHLAHWAIYLGRVERQKDVSPGAIRELLDRALQVSPLNPTARLALAQLEPPSSETATSIRGLGLSRDPLCLAWSGRNLLAAGKKDAALNLYRQALEIASRGEFSQVSVPRFNDDPGVPRYLLPGEERIRSIVRELVARNEWTARDWPAVLPGQTLATLATARLLREQARNDVADALLDPLLNQSGPLAANGPIDAMALAIRAEAFALRSRWQEADDEYRKAIELLDDETLKRSWWFNLADIAFRLADDAKRQAALRATLTVAGSDDISRRATEVLRATSTRPGIPSNRLKAN
jgi:tetratricopeptide (TPR) repeat protein